MIKSIGNVHALAEKAGYRGQELEDVVKYIKSNQRTLGADVDYIWYILTGKEGGFKDLDLATAGKCQQGRGNFMPDKAMVGESDYY